MISGGEDRVVISKQVTMHANGHHRPMPDGRVELTTEVDGKRSVSTHSSADPHEGAYMAAMKALRKAKADGATHVKIVSPNITLINHMNAVWKRRSTNLHPFQHELTELAQSFEVVEWITSAP